LSGGEKRREGGFVAHEDGITEGGKREMAGYNSWVRTAGGEKKFVFGRNALQIAIFRFTQYNADAHNTHAHSPL
jgi:hypothetical protein